MNDHTTLVRRGRPRNADLDGRIAAAAWALLSEIGYADLTFDRVAERVGCTRPTIYRRYPNKQALVLAAMNASLRRIEPEIPATLSGRDALIRHLGGLVAYIDGGGGRSILSLTQARGDDPALRSALDALGDREKQAYVAALVKAIGGALPHDVCMLIIDGMIGAVIYRSVLGDRPTSPADLEMLVDQAVMYAERQLSVG